MTAPVLLVSHGAATLTVRPTDPTRLALEGARTWLEGVAGLVVVSAHDVRTSFTVATAPRLERWADHPAAAAVSWSGRGGDAEPVLAALRSLAWPIERGAPAIDHGAWIALAALDPAGEKPVVTVSLREGLEPAAHLALGQALGRLRSQGLAILASGGLTHNQARFRQGWFSGEAEDTTTGPSERFAERALAWLAEPSGRAEALLAAERDPDFAWCHPTLDHWLPALVAAGAADDDRGQVLHRGWQHALSTALVGFADHLSGRAGRSKGTQAPPDKR